MDADGSNPTRLTDNPGLDADPAWSPDGTKIAFASFRDGNQEVYVMDADGSNPTRLTDNPASDIVPAWSPDGTKIAFASRRDGNPEVYVMDADGSNPTRLTDNPTFDGVPAWSPDGTQDRLRLGARRQPRGVCDGRRRIEPDPPHQLPPERCCPGVVAGRDQDRLRLRGGRGARATPRCM